MPLPAEFHTSDEARRQRLRRIHLGREMVERTGQRRLSGAAGLILLAAGVLFCIPGTGLSRPARAAERLAIAGFSFAPPGSWIREETASAMRAAQFIVPNRAKGYDGIVIFYRFPPGLGGTAERNIARWRSQFKESGDTLDAVVETRRDGDRRLHYFRAAGTLIGRDGEMPDFALHAALLDGPTGRVFLRFVAPKSVASANEAAFRDLAEGALGGGNAQ